MKAGGEAMAGRCLLLDDDPMLRVDNPSGAARQWGIVMATDEQDRRISYHLG